MAGGETTPVVSGAWALAELIKPPMLKVTMSAPEPFKK